MPKAPDGQYEMVLENRQVLTIFFAVVVLCGVFFGLGYIVGKNTMGYIPPAEAGVAAAGKKSAIPPVDTTPATQEQAAPATSDLTFHKALEEKGSSAKLEGQPVPAPTAAPKQAAASAPTEPKPSAASANGGGTISLQVAALSKKEDVDATLSLLQKKGFPATVVTMQADRLFRIQVGPFSSVKEAEEMKARLEQEGFRPYVRK